MKPFWWGNLISFDLHLVAPSQDFFQNVPAKRQKLLYKHMYFYRLKALLALSLIKVYKVLLAGSAAFWKTFEKVNSLNFGKKTNGLVGFHTFSVIFVPWHEKDCFTKFHFNKRWPQRDVLCLFGQAPSLLIYPNSSLLVLFFYVSFYLGSWQETRSKSTDVSTHLLQNALIKMNWSASFVPLFTVLFGDLVIKGCLLHSSRFRDMRPDWGTRQTPPPPFTFACQLCIMLLCKTTKSSIEMKRQKTSDRIKRALCFNLPFSSNRLCKPVEF